VDPDPCHDHVMQQSVSGTILFIGQTPVMWFSKCQGAVQASTYSAEFVVARTAIEEMLSLHKFLSSIQEPVTRACQMFSDNMSVLLNTTEPDSQLKKKLLCIT
jgi:hypothetical protein